MDPLAYKTKPMRRRLSKPAASQNDGGPIWKLDFCEPGVSRSLSTPTIAQAALEKKGQEYPGPCPKDCQPFKPRSNGRGGVGNEKNQLQTGRKTDAQLLQAGLMKMFVLCMTVERAIFEMPRCGNDESCCPDACA
jgi:hypothetical protein